jgi:hypothetical protein
MDQDTYHERYNELKARGKRALYEQYRRIMEEHDYETLPYTSITVDTLIFYILNSRILAK